MSSVISFATVYSLLWWISYLASRAPSIAVGTVFATVALASGMLFFLYSLKYYLSLAIVLSFSQQEVSRANFRSVSGRICKTSFWAI